MSSYVIVGASRGIGYQWLRTLGANKSNTVIGLVRNVGPVQKALESDGLHNVKLLKADMADHVSLNEAAQEVSKITGGALDYLIINGAYNTHEVRGVPPTGFIGREDFLRKDLIASMDVNVLGTVYSINAFLELIRKGSVKKIVVTSSGMGDPDVVASYGITFSMVYATAKAAVNMIVAKFAAELKNEGIMILAISPGLVDTRENVDPQATPAPEDLAMVKKFQESYPNWTGILTPEQSVKHMIKVIDDLTLDKSGQFLSHWGNKQWL